MIDIIVDEKMIELIYKSIKRDNPGIDGRLLKEYTRIAIFMMYKNKQQIEIHAQRKLQEEREQFDDKNKVYTISLKQGNQMRPIWMMIR